MFVIITRNRRPFGPFRLLLFIPLFALDSRDAFVVVDDDDETYLFRDDIAIVAQHRPAIVACVILLLLLLLLLLLTSASQKKSRRKSVVGFFVLFWLASNGDDDDDDDDDDDEWIKNLPKLPQKKRGRKKKVLGYQISREFRVLKVVGLPLLLLEQPQY